MHFHKRDEITCRFNSRYGKIRWWWTNFPQMQSVLCIYGAYITHIHETIKLQIKIICFTSGLKPLKGTSINYAVSKVAIPINPSRIPETNKSYGNDGITWWHYQVLVVNKKLWLQQMSGHTAGWNVRSKWGCLFNTPCLKWTYNLIKNKIRVDLYNLSTL